MRSFEQLRGMHDAAEVIAWVRSLRYFTFLGAVFSGQMELYEELALELDFDDQADLAALLATLGVREQGQCVVGGTPCSVWVHSNTVGIRIFDQVGVTAARVADAQAFETDVIDRFDLAKRVAAKVAGFPNAISRVTFPDLVTRSG